MYQIFLSNLKKTIFIIFLVSTYLQASAIKIMPLGDSITYDNLFSDTENPRSTGDRSGYRNYLWYKLKDAKYDVDFVGSRVAGESIVPVFDPNNEGYPGWTSYALANNTYEWMKKSAPDIVLLHAGSNDFSTSTSGTEHILNEIDRYERDSGRKVIVVLALIINQKSYQSWVTTLNNNVKKMADARIKNGDDIAIVNMETAAGINYTTDMADSAHPTDTGYEKMASVGFRAKGVYVSPSTGSDFSYPQLWVNSFGTDMEW